MIRLLHHDNVATLLLDRPPARNAMRVADWLALAEAVGSIGEACVVILRGEGGFCAGADLGELAALREDPAARVRFREAMRVGIEAVAAIRVPVIAYVAGGCYGAGVALALAADIRVAAPDAMFAVTPAKLGIGYPAQDVARLIERVGRGQAARLLFSAQPIDAAEAARIGLVELMADDATPLAEAIAANAPGAVRMLKQVIANPRGDHDAGFDAAFGLKAFSDALAAFVARPRGTARRT